MAKKYQKDIKVVLPKSDPFRDIAVYGAGEEMIKALGGQLADKGKQPDIVPTKNNPHFMKKSNKKGQSPRSILSPEQKMAMEFGWGGALGSVLGAAAGSFIPVVGTGLGASIGGALGSAVEGTIENKKANQNINPQYPQQQMAPLPQMQFAKGGMLNKRGIPHRGTSEQMPYQTQMQSYPDLEFGNGEQMLAAGGMIKRADGSYSQRGLWDNIRDNKGSGKKPTKEMLEQEAKIKAEYANGGKLPKEILKARVEAHMSPEKADSYIEQYAKGGIHIKPSKRGTFTAAATKHGKSVQAFASQVLANKENYSPAMVKKANFARNAAKWKHVDGGFLQEPAEGVIERRNKNRSREPQEYATFEENFKHMYAQGGRMGAMGPMDVGNIYYADGGRLIPDVRVLGKYKNQTSEKDGKTKEFTEDFGRQMGSQDNTYNYQREGTDKPYLGYFSYNDVDGKGEQLQTGRETYIHKVDPFVSRYLRTKIDSQTNNLNNPMNYANGGINVLGKTKSNIINDNQSFESYGKTIGNNNDTYSYKRLSDNKPELDYFSGKSGEEFQIDGVIHDKVDPFMSRYLKTKINAETNNVYANGGMLNEYNGEKHENGGIPMGPNAEVEGGETSMKMGMGGEQDSTYIYSDRLKVPGKNHTFAEASKRIDNKYNRRTNDKLSNESKRRELNKLMESQEQERAGLVNSAYETIAAYGGPIHRYTDGGIRKPGDNWNNPPIDNSGIETGRLAEEMWAAGRNPRAMRSLPLEDNSYKSPDKLANIPAYDFNEQPKGFNLGTGEQWATGLGYGLQGASLLARQLQLSKAKLPNITPYTMQRQVLNAEPQLREADIQGGITRRNIRDLGASTSSGGAMQGYLASQAATTRSKADIMSDLQNRQAMADMNIDQFNAAARERAAGYEAQRRAAQQTEQAQLFADLGNLGAGITRDYLTGQTQEGILGTMETSDYGYKKVKGRNRATKYYKS